MADRGPPCSADIGIALVSSLLWLPTLAVGQERSSPEGAPPSMQLAQMGVPPGADPTQLPDSQSAGAKLLNQYCTQCHGLPTPNLHSASGWPPVTQRMAAYMQSMSNYGTIPIRAPTPAELQTLTEFLQRHASK